MIIFCFINNYLYWKDYDNDGFYKYEDKTNINKEIDDVLGELKKYNYHNSDDLSTYILLKTNYDILLLKSKYSKNTWQYLKMNEYMYDIIYNMNNALYHNVNNSDYIEKYKKALSSLKDNNWQYFIFREKENLESTLKRIIDEKNVTNDKLMIKELEDKINNINIQLEVIDYRINNNISESKSYLSEALNKYKEYKINLK